MSKPRLLAAAFLAVASTLLVACGDDDSSAETSAQQQHTDGAFIAGMVPHHEGAIEMAEIALEQAEHPEVQDLAGSIIASQGVEIEQLEDVHRRLFDDEVGSMDHGTLGLSEGDAGMAHGASSLEGAEPFDREFIDMMIPHHQGAIRMARIQLESGQDDELNELAEAIIEAQSAEIEQMNQWRQQWYGDESPAGGIPEDGESLPGHEEMGH